MKISEFDDGMEVFGNFLVADCKRCVDSKGSPYLNVVLQDSSGTIDAKRWTCTKEDEEMLVKGKVVYIKGRVNRHNLVLQFRINEIDYVNEDEVNWGEFIAKAPVSLATLQAKLDAYIDSIQDADVKAIVNKMMDVFGKRYLKWPAAVRNHHEFMHGLLYHSITMADMAVKVAAVYPSLNRDILLAGVLIHDLGKTIELSGVNATSFTLEGKLLGHISIGQAELRKAAKEIGMYEYDELPIQERKETHPLYHKKEIAVLLEHMILSHHGQPDFGSPVRPLTREAYVLSVIDDLDAKMTILDKAYLGVEKGASTAKLFNMDERYFYKPYYTEEGTAPAGTSLEQEKIDLK